MSQKISNALISVFYKDGLEPIVKKLHELGINIYTTGGTADFITKLNIPVLHVEDLTGYPSILGGRVKTLHPKVFGGILGRRNLQSDIDEMQQYEIPSLDLVIVDLYPFEETLKAGGSEAEIIEKIDIGGVSLIRAAAKNFNDTLIVSSKNDYEYFYQLLTSQNGETFIEQRKEFASKAFFETNKYDGMIHRWFQPNTLETFTETYKNKNELRYGENPHQKSAFFGNSNDIYEKLAGKEISYNNLNDLEGALALSNEFKDGVSCVIIKHTNACGVAVRSSALEAWSDALSADPVSAFGGIIAFNSTIDEATALEIEKLFFEILIAPSYSDKALEILTKKNNRIILKLKSYTPNQFQYKSMLNGVLVQECDLKSSDKEKLQLVTEIKPNDSGIDDMLFAEKIVKHTKSNTIVLAKNKKLLGLGCGMTSRIDALKHAINKSKETGLSLQDAAMASDAFFPFPDCVEVAHQEGIKNILQPGGSVKDQLSIDYCNQNQLSMVFTGIRHFKH